MAGKRAILHRMIGVFLSGYPLYYTYRQPLCSDFLSPKRQRPDKHTEPREAADMSLGNSLFNARRKSGLSQEEVAEKLGVSRQTISKWELDETLPDIRQSKQLSVLYHVTLDELVDFDIKVKEIEEVIERTSEETQQKIDWTQMWAKKYPVLASYNCFAIMTEHPPFAPSAKERSTFITTVALPIASTASAPSLAKLPTTSKSTSE